MTVYLDAEMTVNGGTMVQSVGLLWEEYSVSHVPGTQWVVKRGAGDEGRKVMVVRSWHPVGQLKVLRTYSG